MDIVPLNLNGDAGVVTSAMTSPGGGDLDAGCWMRRDAVNSIYKLK
jgi:hypothetical protein